MRSSRMRHTPVMDRVIPRRAEKDFYLTEFRGRTLGLVLADPSLDDPAELLDLLAELSNNQTRCVLISRDRQRLQELARAVIEPNPGSNWPAEAWQGMAGSGRIGLWLRADGRTPEADSRAFAVHCREAALRLRLAKVVWVQNQGMLLDADGGRISVADLTDLGDLLAHTEGLGAVQRNLLEQFVLLLEGGTASVNLCSLKGLATELFTYAGSGTFFTRERYAEIRPLGLDDFDPAADLIRLGTEEGFLLQRSPAALRELLSQAFGVFIEGRYLAGIGALLPYPAEDTAEIAGLYTVTRFARGGVGGQLVRYALQSARSAGLGRVFACTTSARVERFFVRQGFKRVNETEIPETKRLSHSSERREKMRYLARASDSSDF